MTLSEELTWRGFVNQTTYKDSAQLDGQPIAFYWGVDPSADSMTVGNLAIAMMVRHFIDYGHKAYLLVGGATGMIGDPDGKAQERELLSLEQLAANKVSIAGQYQQLFGDKAFELVDNYEWFKEIGYLEFLRDTGKHVPMRQMLGRDFVQSRLGETGAGISYAEFSYALIQGYDFLHLHRTFGVTLQVCGADQWGNSITGVDLIRRVTGKEAHVWSAPLVVNTQTGIKFGKSEAGAVWLDPAKTTPTQFYQFWMNLEDAGIDTYLKLYTLFSQADIEQIMAEHQAQPSARIAQTKLAQAVTTLVHGEAKMRAAEAVTKFLTGQTPIGEADPVLVELRSEIPALTARVGDSITESLVSAGLASSHTEARRFLQENAIAINGQKITRATYEADDFQNGRLLLRKGKAFRDSALVELAE